MAARKTMEEVQTALNELTDQVKNMEALGKSLPEDTNQMLDKLGAETVIEGLVAIRVVEIMADYFGVDPKNLDLLKK